MVSEAGPEQDTDLAQKCWQQPDSLTSKCQEGLSAMERPRECEPEACIFVQRRDVPSLLQQEGKRLAGMEPKEEAASEAAKASAVIG